MKRVQFLRQANSLHEFLVGFVRLDGLQMQFFHLLLDEGRGQDLLGRGPGLRLLLQHQFDHVGEFLRVLLVDGRVDAQRYRLEQALHILRLEGRLQRSHFVDHAPQ